MDYAAALAWWFDRVDFEKRPAGRDEIKLDRMRLLLHRLGNPQDRLRVVHVAGSKGKGSTSAFISSCGQAAGCKTGLFTSPHLTDVRERIQVNNQPISPDELTLRLNELKEPVAAMEAAGHPPTFFEIATAAAFVHFRSIGVDVAVMEVGLGGRLDATNVCMPIVSVITSISHDHTAILGDQLTQIAFEKCGIIKPGVPVISGVADPEARPVVRRIANERNSPLFEIDTDFTFSHEPGQVTLSGIAVPPRLRYQLHREPPLDCSFGLLGQHQAANAALAIATIQTLRKAGLPIDNQSIARGLANVRWPARLEVFPGRPLIVLDCAHNVASAQTVVNTLRESFPRCRSAMVFACSSDKDVRGILAVLTPQFDDIVFTSFGVNSRAVPPGRLAEMVGDRKVQIADSSTQALELACRSGADMVVVTGSVFLAGELRPVIAARG
jgi:dihydrofolate synthase/folylpolyglutamate synthase